MCPETMQGPLLHVPGQQAAAGTVVIRQEIERKVFDEELGVVLQALLVKRVEDGVSGAVGCCTSALRHLLAVADGLAAEGTLIDLALLRSREGNAVMFELEYGGHSLTTHVLDRILVAEPVGALDRVVHVEAPVVAVAHISKRSRHAPLCRNGMAAGREHLCNAGRP